MATKQPEVLPKAVLLNEFMRECRHELGKWLRRKREARYEQLTGQELAEMIGFESRQEVSRIEGGGAFPQPHVVTTYAEALAIPPKEMARRMLACAQPWAYAVLHGQAETEALIGRPLMNAGSIMAAPASIKRGPKAAPKKPLVAKEPQ